uniref:Uncharacterized protein n=1 Tax=Knipowitschia caucasica TaxID=637954 RepID=A0AAV2LXK5_KNICA
MGVGCLGFGWGGGWGWLLGGGCGGVWWYGWGCVDGGGVGGWYFGFVGGGVGGGGEEDGDKKIWGGEVRVLLGRGGWGLGEMYVKGCGIVWCVFFLGFFGGVLCGCCWGVVGLGLVFLCVGCFDGGNCFFWGMVFFCGGFCIGCGGGIGMGGCLGGLLFGGFGVLVVFWWFVVGWFGCVVVVWVGFFGGFLWCLGCRAAWPLCEIELAT